MYLDTCHYTQKGKPLTRILLHTSYREGGKVKHKTIANLSQCSAEEIKAIRLVLKHKLSALSRHLDTPVTTRQGLAVGAVFALQAVAKRLGLVKALGRKRESGLALWLILARLIEPGSRFCPRYGWQRSMPPAMCWAGCVSGRRLVRRVGLDGAAAGNQ